MRTVCLGGQHELQSLEGINDGGAFQSRTAGNGVEPPCFAILHRALAAAFGDVERNRECGPTKLVRQGAVAAGNPPASASASPKNVTAQRYTSSF